MVQECLEPACISEALLYLFRSYVGIRNKGYVMHCIRPYLWPDAEQLYIFEGDRTPVRLKVHIALGT